MTGINVNVKPAEPKAAGSQRGAFNAYVAAHPIMITFAGQIWKWAKEYGVDPIVMAALFWRESFSEATRTGQDPRTIVSPTGEGVGIGQINPNAHVGEKTPWGAKITRQLLNNADFNIHWSAYYFSQQVAAFGDYDRAYQAYAAGPNNPDAYKGPPLLTTLPKGYVPQAGLSPTQQGQKTVEQQHATDVAKAVAYDRWVVRNPNGTLGFAEIKDQNKPPKNIIVAQGLPLTRSDLLRAKSTLDDLYQSYAGRPATNREVAGILESGISQFGLMTQLSKQPSFKQSPVYTRHAAGIVGTGRKMFGANWKGDDEFVRQAIVGSWDGDTIVEKLRQRPEYLTGPVYQGTVASLRNVYQTIYGVPDQYADVSIKEAALQDWSPDQFAGWLRGQPQYTSSPEYQSKALSFLDQLGLITGSVPVLKPGKAPQNTQPAGGVLPDSPRIPGKPAPGMVGTLSPSAALTPALAGRGS